MCISLNKQVIDDFKKEQNGWRWIQIIEGWWGNKEVREKSCLL